MNKVKYVMIVGVAIVAGLLLIKYSSNSVSSQTAGSNESEALAILKNRSLRKTDPQRVIKAMEEVAAPYKARPVTSTEPIPDEVISALVDLLDFERPDRRDPMFNISAEVYPVMDTLVLLRKPVLPGLVGILENEDGKSEKSRNAVLVIRKLISDDVKASDFLRVEASGSKSETGKERLLSAAERISEEHLKFQNRVEN